MIPILDNLLGVDWECLCRPAELAVWLYARGDMDMLWPEPGQPTRRDDLDGQLAVAAADIGRRFTASVEFARLRAGEAAVTATRSSDWQAVTLPPAFWNLAQFAVFRFPALLVQRPGAGARWETYDSPEFSYLGNVVPEVEAWVRAEISARGAVKDGPDACARCSVAVGFPVSRKMLRPAVQAVTRRKRGRPPK